MSTPLPPEIELDAKRYRKLRRHLWIRNQTNMRGENLPGLAVRPGFTYLNCKTIASNSDETSAQLDAAIDASLKESEHGQ